MKAAMLIGGFFAALAMIELFTFINQASANVITMLAR